MSGFSQRHIFMELIVIFCLLIATFLEGSLTSIPLVLLCLVTFAAYTKSQRVYGYALIAGCLLDILTGRILGITSLVFVLLLGMIFLYQRKYEINSHIFIFITSLMMPIIFGIIFHSTHMFLNVLSSILISQILFFLWKVVLRTTHTVSSLAR